MDTPLVIIAVAANETRAIKGREDSMMNMKGTREVARASDDSEKILRERNVRANGPRYVGVDVAESIGVVSCSIDADLEVL